jgi:hypothetical protein
MKNELLVKCLRCPYFTHPTCIQLKEQRVYLNEKTAKLAMVCCKKGRAIESNIGVW